MTKSMKISNGVFAHTAILAALPTLNPTNQVDANKVAGFSELFTKYGFDVAPADRSAIIEALDKKIAEVKKSKGTFSAAMFKNLNDWRDVVQTRVDQKQEGPTKHANGAAHHSMPPARHDAGAKPQQMQQHAGAGTNQRS